MGKKREGEVVNEKESRYAMFNITDLSQFVLTDKRLQLSDMWVIGCLVKHMSKFGYVGHTQTFLAEKVAMTQPAFARSIRRLIEYGYVEWVAHNGRRCLKVNKQRITKRASADFREDSNLTAEGFKESMRDFKKEIFASVREDDPEYSAEVKH